MQIKKQQLELDMEQQTGSTTGKNIKAAYYHLAYLTYMHSTLMQDAGVNELQAEIKIVGRNYQ